jgi:hypothetical protein
LVNSSLSSLIREHVTAKASNTRIISKLQDIGCLLRCEVKYHNLPITEYDIRNAIYDKIDPLYSAKHDFVKNKIIDVILDRFGGLAVVKSNHSRSTGTLDIAFENIIVLKFKRKTIGIEIKSGIWADAKTFNQIQRYLLNVERLLVVRFPTEDVVMIDTAPIAFKNPNIF